MTKHTDPKPYISDRDDTEGNAAKFGISPEGTTDDTEGNNFRGFISPEGEADDVEGNHGKIGAPAVSPDGESDDTDGNSAGGRF